MIGYTIDPRIRETTGPKGPYGGEAGTLSYAKVALIAVS